MMTDFSGSGSFPHTNPLPQNSPPPHPPQNHVDKVSAKNLDLEKENSIHVEKWKLVVQDNAIHKLHP